MLPATLLTQAQDLTSPNAQGADPVQLCCPQPYKYMDSCNMTENHSSTSYVEVPDPKKGEEGWPRLLLENRCYQSDVFRKLHMELAVRQDGLEVGCLAR